MSGNCCTRTASRGAAAARIDAASTDDDGDRGRSGEVGAACPGGGAETACAAAVAPTAGEDEPAVRPAATAAERHSVHLVRPGRYRIGGVGVELNELRGVKL